MKGRSQSPPSHSTRILGFGRRLEQLREARGLSRSELARLLGVADKTIYNWEHREQPNKPGDITELSRILGTTAAYLEHGTGGPARPAAGNVDEILAEAKIAIALALLIDVERVRLRLEIDG